MSQLLYASKTEVGNNGQYEVAHPVGGGSTGRRLQSHSLSGYCVSVILSVGVYPTLVIKVSYTLFTRHINKLY